ncbi:hypothetical protein AU197_05550 [Mycobacterium sp. IS-1590]|uniref:prolipoprotein diacylglyceryl transferase n=1 Tax=Mycobacterium sp. IS-1590 TaxID=1772286 RepID=UPI000749145D|nr:prolipoprotein diacylglyceryl transferase [Mycobacterium sp. IS-1590]KUI34075.1 hypothetical protein AU197_05550 [Mycobacterium sp. IS-1590]
MTTSVLAAIPSPAQGVWQLGPVPIRAYAICIIVGIVAALIIGDRRWEARGGERGVIYDIALWAVPFGLIGGRLYHVATDWWRYFGDDGAGLAGVIRIWDGGLGIWGAVAFGAVGAWIACRRRGIPLPAFADAVAPGVILAQGIGRLGNYFNQELWGAETTLPWALKIYERRDSSGMIDNLNGVSTGEVVHLVHPTFLYELLWNLLVFAVLIYVDRRFKFGHGRLFALYVAGYCVGRFWIELLRVDDATLIEGVRINSFTATFVFIGAVVYIMAAPKGREDPASLRGTAEPERPTVEDLTEELAAVASTTGVFAAAKAAAEEDETSKTSVSAESLTADVAEDEATAAEDVSAEELGADVAGVPAEDLEEAEEFAAEGDDESDFEAVAEAEALAEEVEEAPAEEIAEAEEFADAGSAAEGGVGAVEGEEASDALTDAAEAHESAVEGEAAAEELANVAAAQTVATPPAKERRRLRFWPKRGRKDVVAAEEPFGGADVSGAAVPGVGGAADAGGVADADGVGAVEGEEASDALAEAAEVHEGAVEGEAAAEELADEAEAEADEVEAVAAAEALGDEVDEAPAEEILEAEEFAEAGQAADADGVGAVEGEEASDALADAAEAHESAVEGEAAAEELADEAEAEADEAGEPAAEDELLAEELARAAEAQAEEPTDTQASVGAEAEGDGTAEGQEAPDSGEPADIGGVGTVEGEEAGDAIADAAEAHESAVEGEATAAELADEAEAEATEPTDAQATEDAATAEESTDEADTAEVSGVGAVEGEAASEEPADNAETSDGGRVRKWLRRRRRG